MKPSKACSQCRGRGYARQERETRADWTEWDVEPCFGCPPLSKYVIKKNGKFSGIRAIPESVMDKARAVAIQRHAASCQCYGKDDPTGFCYTQSPYRHARPKPILPRALKARKANGK